MGSGTGNSRSGLVKVGSGVIGLKWAIVVVVGLKKWALDPVTVILGSWKWAVGAFGSNDQ